MMAAFIYLITLLLILTRVLSYDNIVHKMLIPKNTESIDLNRWLNELQDKYIPIYHILSVEEGLQFKYDIRKVRRLSPDERKKNVVTFAEDLRGDSLKQVLDFIGLVEEHEGYVAEEHRFQNDDEYNLTLHRISGSPRSPKKDGKPVVFIQHGLLLSSDAYVLNGPEKDLAFLLADEGYDVWFGNARGNTYSRSHASYSVDDPKFWNFTFHEVGITDLPNSIDYVLAETNNTSLTLIGYSIGATESYIMLSEKPNYNEKINLLVGISPLGFWHPVYPDRCKLIYNKNSCGEKHWNLKSHYQKLENEIKFSNNNEEYPQTYFMQYFAYSKCREVKSCNTAIDSFFGEKPTTAFNSDSIIKLFSHVPAGTSAKTLLHLYQNINSGEFTRYDPLIHCADLDRNTDAKPYDLSSIEVPVVVFNTDKEAFFQIKDEDALKRQISNLVIYKIKVPGSDKSARMLDFPLSPHAKLINKSIVGILKHTLISSGQYS